MYIKCVSFFLNLQSMFQWPICRSFAQHSIHQLRIPNPYDTNLLLALQYFCVGCSSKVSSPVSLPLPPSARQSSRYDSDTQLQIHFDNESNPPHIWDHFFFVHKHTGIKYKVVMIITLPNIYINCIEWHTEEKPHPFISATSSNPPSNNNDQPLYALCIFICSEFD